MARRGFRGFTLIELLVVISIIGVLAAIVLASLVSARTKANVARAQSEMKQLSEIMLYAKSLNGQRLMDITGSSWSAGKCSFAPADLRNISSSSDCYLQWTHDLSALNALVNPPYDGVLRFTRDPWGSPYILDENEGESGLGCTQDDLTSAGPDGEVGTSDDLDVYVPNGTAACGG